MRSTILTCALPLLLLGGIMPATAGEGPRLGGTYALVGTAGTGDPLAAAGVRDEPRLFAETGGAVADATEREVRNPKLSMVYSLILPGAGQWYLGEKNRAAFYFVAEAGIWATYFIFRHQGGVEKDRYREFASIFAGVDPRNDDDYYRVIGNFQASEGLRSANEAVRRTARSIYPNDREAQEQYLRENGYFDDDAWTWENEESFLKYRDIRAASEDAYGNASLTLGLLLVNRLVSMLDAGLTARRYTQPLDDGGRASLGMNLHADPQGPGATVTLARTF